MKTRVSRRITATAEAGEGERHLQVQVEHDEGQLPYEVTVRFRETNGGPQHSVILPTEALERAARLVALMRNEIGGPFQGLCADHGYFNEENSRNYRCPTCFPVEAKLEVVS